MPSSAVICTFVRLIGKETKCSLNIRRVVRPCLYYKFSLFNINRSYIVRNYGVAATFLGGLASN